jgi:transposase InsO family protein
MRWRGRQARGEELVQRPGPRKVEPFALDRLYEQILGLDHGDHRTPGTGALYRQHRLRISRRDLQALVKRARQELRQERQALERRIEWTVPGLIWSMDDKELGRALHQGKIFLHNVQDLASRYKLPPLVGALPHGEQVAAHLETLWQNFGVPLILKRDNGSNLNHAVVTCLLEEHGVIPLNSPPYYPPYNGAIEHSQDEMGRRLGAALAISPIDALPVHAEVAAHDLNHKRRRSLAWRTSCEAFSSGKHNTKAYTRRRRKESYEQMKALAILIVQAMRCEPCAEVDAEPINTAATVWRLAVETWLYRHGLITVSVNGKVLPHFPSFRSHN